MARRRRSGIRVYARTGSGMAISARFEDLSPWGQAMTVINGLLSALSRLGAVGALLSLPILAVAIPVMFIVWPLARLTFWLIALPFRAINATRRSARE